MDPNYASFSAISSRFPEFVLAANAGTNLASTFSRCQEGTQKQRAEAETVCIFGTLQRQLSNLEG
jgi:hypothetical protein